MTQDTGRVYISYGASAASKLDRGEELTADDWFLVQGGVSMVNTPISMRMSCERLLRSGRKVWAIDLSGGPLQEITEETLDSIDDFPRS